MIIIILGIIALVYCSKYKKQPLLRTRSTLKTLTIVHGVFFGFAAVSLLSSIALFATGSFFEFVEDMIMTICRELDVSTRFIAEIIGDVSTFINSIIWIAITIDCLVFIFGLIALICGIVTLSNKELIAVAEANTAAENQRRQAMYAQQNYNYYQQNYQNPAYNQQNPAYYQQNTAYNQPAQSYTATQAPFPAASAAAEQQQPWVCSCGTSNIAVANFCGHCGNKRQ